MNPEELFRQLMIGRWQIAMVISGGGTGAIPTCLRRSGASKNFVEVAIPYSRAAMADYSGGQPIGPSASIDTARQLAMRAQNRARQLSDMPQPIPVGISLTAALPTVPARDQQNQIHVVLKSDGVTKEWSQVLGPDVTTRSEAETVAETMLMRAIELIVSTTGSQL